MIYPIYPEPIGSYPKPNRLPECPELVMHAFKVGVALVLVSSFYYYQPFGPFTDYLASILEILKWRGVATLVARGLALGAHQLASLFGRTVEPILLTTFVFVTGNPKQFSCVINVCEVHPNGEGGIRDVDIHIDVLTDRCPGLEMKSHSLLVSNLDTVSHFLKGFSFQYILQKFVFLLYIYLFTSGNLTEFGDEYFEAREYGDIEVVEKRRRNLERYKMDSGFNNLPLFSHQSQTINFLCIGKVTGIKTANGWYYISQAPTERNLLSHAPHVMIQMWLVSSGSYPSLIKLTKLCSSTKLKNVHTAEVGHLKVCVSLCHLLCC
ncbi:BnaC08g15170D [Brassica napus]|uniref:BnaC08g15170D protein n=1 Tax=Brassica napus TaxID=3708 RepID=A0A078H155_BRANA|nr:BnaC08g15170D [Brassica napus]